MNNHLDKLEEKLTRELMEVEIKRNYRMKELLTTLQRTKEEIYQSQVNINNIKKFASELQAFVGLKQIQGISIKNENYIQSLVDDSNLKQLLNLLNNVNSFGKIIIETKSSGVDIEAYTQNQAQQRIVSIPVRSVNDVMLKLKQSIKADLSNVIGCCILSNDKMVFVNYYLAKVIVVHKDGSIDFIINLRPGEPFDVTCIDGNTIAVSVLGQENQVLIIDLSKRSITKEINTKSKVWGITYNNGSLICCVLKGLIRIDLKDNSITPIVRCSLPWWPFVSTNDNNLYYTNYIKNKVTCCDMNGKVQWEFCDENVLVTPGGITTDSNNNIYVAGFRPNNVVVISPDGQSHKVLLSDSEGFEIHRGIHCDRASNQLLSINGRNNAGSLYDISTTPT